MPIKSARYGENAKGRNVSKKNTLYASYKWIKASKLFKIDNPLCSNCQLVDITQFSKVTDHIIPIRVGGAIWDQDNWQPLCRKCDTKKRLMQKSGTFIIKAKESTLEPGKLVPGEELKHF